MFRSFVLAASVALSSAPVSADEKANKALVVLQGQWKVEKIVAAGEQVSAEDTAKLTFTFKDNQMIPSDNPKDVATVKLDPDRKPTWFDVTDRAKETMLGVYELSGDTLKICLADPGAERPKGFGSAKGSKTTYMVLKRASK
ncbi:TIGR03067 domain-containing protein [Gemmata sp. JC717]|uniref:TIGR03067 domain-containing protein n=1 Tax=Gemmata algarum TaxID=2975278 RepID=UPI0021BAA4BE|nr:TIGR03067 domain-containing protein [Gemmata algarum]MDY3557300.1 TIGR03067 domain-containing protein [Gemmata algarum]